MKNKRRRRKDLRTNIIEVPVEEIQSFAEANFERELTDIELNRIKTCFWDNENARDLLCQSFIALIEDAMNEDKNDWKAIDNLI